MNPAQRSLLFAILIGVLTAFAAFGLWQLLRNPTQQAPITASYASAVQRAAPSVVQVEAQRRDDNTSFSNNPALDELFGTDSLSSTVTSQGSGIVVRADGHVLTNYHVVRDASSIAVTLTDRRRLLADVVGIDAETDIAVLKVRAPDPLQPIAAGDDGRLQVGDVVLAIGNPYGIGQTVTQGIVSALRRQVGGFSVYDQFIQTDAAINPGSSGGALVNLQGELIGLNTSVFNGAEDAQGISFAIPSRMLFSIVDQLIDRGEVSRGWLGIRGNDVALSPLRNRASSGVFVTGVYQGQPAQKAGILPGDVIDGLDESPTPDSRSLQYVSSHIPPNTEVIVYGRRNGKPFKAKLLMGTRPRQ
ncbi:MAG: S1C family serine protease [Granulosicoccaceae bacterium]